MKREDQWKKIINQVEGYFDKGDDRCHSYITDGKVQNLPTVYLNLGVVLARIKDRWPRRKFMYERGFKSELLCRLNKVGIRRLTTDEAKEVLDTHSVLLKMEVKNVTQIIG